MANRMFLVARYTDVLRNKKKPQEGFRHDESIVITKNLKSRDKSEASVILDVSNRTVVKNRFNERPFEELWSYYVQHYGDYINQWLKSQIQHP